MKRFFGKLGYFFWWRGFLKFVLWTATLVIFLYVEEDWRGAHTWAETKAKWEARGESFNYNRLIPPPVPDDQNFAMIPLFKLEPDPENKGELAPLTLRKALRENLRSSHFAPGGGWQNGELPDLEKLQARLVATYIEAFPAAPPPHDSLAQLDAPYPFLTDLRVAADGRPYCRFQPGSLDTSSFSKGMNLLLAQLRVSQLLSLHAILALNAHRPDLALDDIGASLKLIGGVSRNPSLVSGLVVAGAITSDYAVIDEGLSFHAWNDAQLATLQNELGKLDFLSTCQLAMRGQALGWVVPTMDFMKADGASWAKQPGTMFENQQDNDRFVAMWRRFPGSWLDINKSRMVDFIFEEVTCVDPKARLVFPKRADDLERQVVAGKTLRKALTPWNAFFSVSTGVFPPLIPRISQAQVWCDQARIACALERHHLAHGVYPDSLDVLVPACIAALPRDIMNGEPYHYRLQSNGEYLLYSVGWNQVDDGGKIFHPKDYSPPYQRGDWVWPMPKQEQPR